MRRVNNLSFNLFSGTLHVSLHQESMQLVLTRVSFISSVVTLMLPNMMPQTIGNAILNQVINHKRKSEAL